MFDSSKIQPHIAFTDLREWMAEAEKLGELKTVLGASWQEEIGLATEEFGMDLWEHVGNVIQAMRTIAADLGFDHPIN